MNVFVLCTGRCGSVTFSKACEHITNFSAAHESRRHLIGDDRLRYPDAHIEADNRLSWMLGRLERAYGDDAFYVHLTRDPQATARSFTKRWTRGIMRAYHDGVLIDLPRDADRLAVALDLCETVNTNIEAFLKNKTRTMRVRLEHAKEDFARFWSTIDAQGNLSAALAEWDHPYNETPPPRATSPRTSRERALGKAVRVVKKLPQFVRSA